MTPLTITIIAVFLGTAAACGWVALAVSSLRHAHPASRLAKYGGERPANLISAGLLKEELHDDESGGLKDLWKSFGIHPRVFTQWMQHADLPIGATWIWLMAAICCGAMIAIACMLRAPVSSYPIVGLIGGALPLSVIRWRRKRRMLQFSRQFPDALELMASALRSGNTLQSSMQVIVDEFLPPLSQEFEKITETVKLGISVEQALDEFALRVAQPDVEFFVTSVSMQRQTGGNLAEILDKISWLVRERFYIQGQVQALTGEGRMSGIVLMAMPIILFVVVYVLNPGYVMLLWTEPLGRKMLGGAILLQVLGALAIRKIVNIKI